MVAVVILTPQELTNAAHIKAWSLHKAASQTPYPSKSQPVRARVCLYAPVHLCTPKVAPNHVVGAHRVRPQSQRGGTGERSTEAA